MLPTSVSVFSGYSGFLSQSKDMQLRLTGHSKLPVGINGCLSVCVNPAIKQRLVQGVPCPHPLTAEMGPSNSCNPLSISSYK